MAKGLTGEVFIQDGCVVMKKKGVLSGIVGTSGGVKVPLRNVTAIDFKEPSILTGSGYLQVVYPGATVSSKKEDKLKDQNCIHFNKKQMPEFELIKLQIEEFLYKN